jgi:predicted methyltransferase
MHVLRKAVVLSATVSLLGSLGCATSGPSPEELAAMEAQSPARRTEEKITNALMSRIRTKKEKARGRDRHPLITMTFFGLEDTMKVIELQPGWGWYTKVLAPVLADTGKLTVAMGDPAGAEDDYAARQARYLMKQKEKHPAELGKMETIVLSTTGDINLGPAGSADMVLSIRCLHTWMANGYADKMLAAVKNVLRAGGTFAVEGHRAEPGKTDAVKGYVAEADAIKLIESAGFKLDGKTEFNANARDTKDHPKGVYSLPPTLTPADAPEGATSDDGSEDSDDAGEAGVSGGGGAASERAKFIAIGESDRFTLRFKKPE